MSADPSQFDEPIVRIRRRIEELTAVESSGEAEPGRDAEIAELRQKLTKVAHEIYSNLSPWQKTLVARHPQRPYTLDFIAALIDDFSEVHGDRKFADDPAIVAGFGRFRGQAVCVVGHQKGRNTKEKVIRNFGQPRPEGFRKALRVMKLAEKFKLPVLSFVDTQGAYPGLGAEDRGQAVCVVGHQKGRNTKEKVIRNFGQPRPEGFRKALRVMKLAEKFKLPVLSFVDTQGAYPGLGAEERGQAEAIAVNLREMAAMQVPVIISVIGEGGSGGALALGVGDRVLMLEHAVYSVISPEGCAAILWKNSASAPDAAAAMKITAQDLKKLNVIDEIVPEPPGGAHADPTAAADLLAPYLEKALRDLMKLKPAQLVDERYKKFRKMGVFEK